MSKYLLRIAIFVLLGCGPPPHLCAIAENLTGVQLASEGMEVTSLLVGPASECGPDATVKLELTAPSGARVPVTGFDLTETSRLSAPNSPVNVRAASVHFSASEVGTWSLRARWSTGGESQRSVLVAPLLSPPSVAQRFVDPLRCHRGPFRTQSGFVVCQSSSNISVYGPDGQVSERFAGEQLAVRGDEVWSWSANGALEHRTALPAGLRFDGSVPLAHPSPEGETVPGRALRAADSRVIEATWDGVTLSSTTVAEGYPIDDHFVTQGTETWSSDACRIQRGCTIAVCEPVRRCPSVPLGATLGIEPDRVWSTPHGFKTGTGVMAGRLTATLRPFEIGRGASAFIDLFFEEGVVLFQFVGNQVPGIERARFTTTDGVVFIPHQRTPDTIDFVAIRPGGLPLTLTADWLVSKTEDDYTFLFTPLPSIP